MVQVVDKPVDTLMWVNYMRAGFHKNSSCDELSSGLNQC
jgi:hypothetical protein